MPIQKAFSGNFGPSRLHSYKFSDFSIKFSISSTKHLIETLEEDIKLVGKGIPGLESREDSIFKNNSWHFWTIRNQSQRRERRFVISKITRKRKLLDRHSGGRSEARSCGQNDSVCRDNSKAMECFGIFGLSRF